MPNYQLEIKQKEIHPRCRVSREFMQSLTENRDVHTSGRPGLFSFVALCSFVTSSRVHLRLEGISYVVEPGECICMMDELLEALRLRTKQQVTHTLWVMQNRGLIQCTLLDRGSLVKFKVNDWEYVNNLLNIDCANRRENGFFYLSAATAVELVSAVKCSEADILLDLIFSAVYRDDRVKGSYSGPVAYFRDETESPVITYAELSQRWGISCTAVGRILEKFENTGYISQRGHSGKAGLAIYLEDELARAFQCADVMLDKNELPLSMSVKLPDLVSEAGGVCDTVAKKVLQLLTLQGLGCAECRHCTHKLYPLTGEEKACVGHAPCIGFRMEILCARNVPLYVFDLFISPSES